MTATLEVAVAAAMAHSKAQASYKKAFRDYFNSLEVLDDDTFWKMLDHLRMLLIERRVNGQALKRAVDELFRLPSFWQGCLRGTCGGGKDPGYTTIDAIRFAKTYDEKKAALYDPLFDVVTGRGDDSYGDLLDSLPILGRELYENCVNKKFRNNRAFGAARAKAALAVAPHPQTAGLLTNFVLNGENYVEMSLFDEAESRFVQYALDMERERQGDDFDEEAHEG